MNEITLKVDGETVGTFKSTTGAMGGDWFVALAEGFTKHKNAGNGVHYSVDYNEGIGVINLNVAAYGAESITVGGEN